MYTPSLHVLLLYLINKYLDISMYASSWYVRTYVAWGDRSTTAKILIVYSWCIGISYVVYTGLLS